MLLLCAAAGLCPAVDLKPETIAGFRPLHREPPKQKCNRAGAASISSGLTIRRRFVRSLLAGAVVAQPVQGNGVVTLPGGLIQDWIGAVFVPKTTLKETLSVVQDYPQHPEIYKPDVTEVKVLSHTGNDFTIRTRVVKSKFFISDVLDIDNQIHFVPLDPSESTAARRASESSRSATRANTTSTNCPPATIAG